MPRASPSLSDLRPQQLHPAKDVAHICPEHRLDFTLLENRPQRSSIVAFCFLQSGGSGGFADGLWLSPDKSVKYS